LPQDHIQWRALVLAVFEVYYQGVGKMHGDNRKPLCNSSVDDSNASLSAREII
jgi:hypothetical protein